MRRREFITLLGSAATWPLTAQAQQRAKSRRRVGVLLPAAQNDAQYQAWLAAFVQALQRSGWTIGGNVSVDVRWATTSDAEIRRHAAELIAQAPDVILAHGLSTVVPLHQATRSVPTVFIVVAEPVAAGIVDSLARPGGNATGFTTEEYAIAGKRLEVLKQIAPNVVRIGVLSDSSNSASVGELEVIRSTAPSQGLQVVPIVMTDAAEIERAVTAFAQSSNGGLILTPSGLGPRYRDLLVMLAAQFQLPTIFFQRLFVTAGGLISYGPDFNDEYRRAASYVARILSGDKPADLPVQAPTKFELVINLKTAKALGLTVSRSLLTLADEVIE